MLKLPKGLKKKKKGKKSKKDQELFTEEELEQYKREHQQHTEVEEHPQEKTENDEEWSKFAALTTGVDSILKKTQGDLDRIKSTSFFQRVAPPSEKKLREEAQQDLNEAEGQESEEQKEEEVERDPVQELLNAVVELSESEEDSEVEDTAFDTSYVDKAETGELPLAYIPESPQEEFSLGPDPFDTSYAEKVIHGPEVVKGGKKLVSIGSAVQVLTGRVETVSTTRKRPQRRGPKNLLLQSFEEPDDGEAAQSAEPEPEHSVLNLLDDTSDLPTEDIEIDLSVSLHLKLQEQKAKEEKPASDEDKVDNNENVLDEFDVLKNKDQESDDDEFAQLAQESLTKTDEVVVLDPSQVRAVTPVVLTDVPNDWAEFQVTADSEKTKEKPKRPPPPTRPATGPHIGKAASPGIEDDDDDFKVDEDDPFDTAYVEKIIPKSLDYDEDFDPRALDESEEVKETKPEVDLFATPNIEVAPEIKTEQLSVLKKDLLSSSTHDLTDFVDPIEPSAQEEDEYIDPFDTSAVDKIVAPGKTELKFLEKEFLESDLKKSLSDPDFDPRADEEVAHPPPPTLDLKQRKSSLSLNIHSGISKVVSFTVTSPDLLEVDSEASGRIQKPLTPYYNRNPSLLKTEGDQEEDEDEDKEEDIDPFDTSFVPRIAPTKVELDLLEQEILTDPVSTLKHSLSDPDFDPRATTPVTVAPNIIERKPVETDLFLAVEDHNIKVLTPAKDNSDSSNQFDDIDPFDTSIAVNIKPGVTELKLLEDELIEKKVEPVPDTSKLDILSDTQDNSLYFKVLTPQKSASIDLDQADDFDPFDTSFAANLGPGETEIKLIESEFIN